jgi:WD40 repeat protein
MACNYRVACINFVLSNVFVMSFSGLQLSTRRLAQLAAIAAFFTVHTLLALPVRAQAEDAETGEQTLENSSLQLCQNLQPVHTLKGHLDAVTVLAKTSDNQTLLTGSEDGSIKIWDLETGELKASFFEHIGAISTIEISPDNKTIWLSWDRVESCIVVYSFE